MYKIPLIKPYITQEVKDKVIDVLDSGYLTEGPVTHELETLFQEYIGCTHAIAVTSCTTGLELALRALGIGPGDEVIVPDYTYPATASVVNIVGATVVIVDVDQQTMLIDYDAIQEAITEKTKAIIPVSLFGNPLDYGKLNKIKNQHNIKIIEDAACSLGATYQDKKVGSLADISVFSFHPRKFITTGEGGMVTTDNDEWAAWMNSYKHFGMSKSDERQAIQFERVGTNYKLSNLQAAIGVVQMQHVEELLLKRYQLAENYVGLLKNVSNIVLPQTTEGGVHSYQSFCIFIENRDEIMRQLRDIGIEVQIGTFALHKHKAFNDNPFVRVVGSMKNSQYVFENCLTLPLFHDITPNEQEIVIKTLESKDLGI
ncbi:MAG: DegT/DnrJ/EryC1/StrS aminotransferase family protein [bacterium]|nr:DegT/DnrJ/EryC1/StrS aminotransferase family protein [bacterium]MBU1918291.1 DegT/DnrJ/EryC1/StrS aminotransferase family protein [bacterium]